MPMEKSVNLILNQFRLFIFSGSPIPQLERLSRLLTSSQKAYLLPDYIQTSSTDVNSDNINIQTEFDGRPGKYLTATESEGVLIQRVITACLTNGTTTCVGVGGRLSKGR